MNWDKTLSTIGAVAPAIATALGGPLAGLAVGAIANVFGLGAGATNEQISAAVAGATPADMLALKKADQDFAIKMEEIGVSLEDIAFKDRQSARDRAKAMNDYTPQLVGVLVLGVWAVINFQLLNLESRPVIAPELVGRILGMVDSATVMFLAWLYGTNRSSAAKDATISKLAG